MFERYHQRLTQLIKAATQSSGDTPLDLRELVFERGKAQSSGGGMPDNSPPPEAVEFADKIAYVPYEIRDEDLAALKADGYSDDAVLEIIYAASLAAGVGRLEVVKAAMRGERRLP